LDLNINLKRSTRKYSNEIDKNNDNTLKFSKNEVQTEYNHAKKSHKYKQFKEDDSTTENSISMILNEYENKITKMVTNNKDKERIKMLYDELNRRNKDDLLRNYKLTGVNNVYVQETSKKRDDIEDFEKNLKDLRMSILGEGDKNDNREKKIEDLVNKTSVIVSKLEKENLSFAVQDITTKILQELKFDNESRLQHVQSTLNDGLKENTSSLHHLERKIAELKEEKDLGFNKTASFKFEE